MVLKIKKVPAIFRKKKDPLTLPRDCKVPPSESVDREGVTSFTKYPYGEWEPWMCSFVKVWDEKESLQIRATIRAMYFLEGPNEASLDKIEAESGAEIFTCIRQPDDEVPGLTKHFHLEGSQEQVQRAGDMICNAINLYRDLVEGGYQGQSVPRMHKLDDIMYRYTPPPRAAGRAARVDPSPAELEITPSIFPSKKERQERLRRIAEELLEHDEGLIRSNVLASAAALGQAENLPKSGKEAWRFHLGETVVFDHDAERNHNAKRMEREAVPNIFDVIPCINCKAKQTKESGK